MIPHVADGFDQIYRNVLVLDADGDEVPDVIELQADTNWDGRGPTIDPQPMYSRLYMNLARVCQEKTEMYFNDLLNAEVRWCGTPLHVDHNGLPDVFIPGGNGNRCRLYMNSPSFDPRDPNPNDPSGSWRGFFDHTNLVYSPLTEVCYGSSVAAGDLDKDGYDDLVVFQYRPDLGAEHGQMRILMRRLGGFDPGYHLNDETETRLPLRSEPTVYGTLADVDGDGDLDILYCNLLDGTIPLDNLDPNTPTLRCLLNDGEGYFSDGPIMPERPDKWSREAGVRCFALGQFRAGGRPDLYVVNFGQADNPFADAVLINKGPEEAPFSDITYPLNDRVDADRVAIADFDEDGRNDVLLTGYEVEVGPILLRNESAGDEIMFRRVSLPELIVSQDGSRSQGTGVAVFDFNLDRVPDIWCGFERENHLLIGCVKERESNETPLDANIPTFPALVMGEIASTEDQDVFKMDDSAVAKFGLVVSLSLDSDALARVVIVTATGRHLAESGWEEYGVHLEFMPNQFPSLFTQRGRLGEDQSYYVRIETSEPVGYRLGLKHVNSPEGEPPF